MSEETRKILKELEVGTTYSGVDVICRQYKEIERLSNIIKEALILTENTRFEEQYASDEILLPINNKLRESGIRNYIKVEGSDKK